MANLCCGALLRKHPSPQPPVPRTSWRHRWFSQCYSAVISAVLLRKHRHSRWHRTCRSASRRRTPPIALSASESPARWRQLAGTTGRREAADAGHHRSKLLMESGQLRSSAPSQQNARARASKVRRYSRGRIELTKILPFWKRRFQNFAPLLVEKRRPPFSRKKKTKETMRTDGRQTDGQTTDY
jgi:hypothetical protein